MRELEKPGHTHAVTHPAIYQLDKLPFLLGKHVKGRGRKVKIFSSKTSNGFVRPKAYTIWMVLFKETYQSTSVKLGESLEDA